MIESAPKVVIVGAGIIGTTLAHDFASRGARVTVLDKNEVAKGATSGSFAWITNQTKFRNADSLGEEGARHYFNLHRLSHLRWRYLQDIIGDLPIRWTGCFQSAEPGSNEANELAAELDRRLRWGSPTYRVSAEDAREIESAFEPGAETFIFYTPDEGMMSPVQLTSKMLDAAIARGAHYSPHDAYEGFCKTSGGYEITSTTGRREADLLIFAGGIANPDLVEGTGLKAPLTHSTGSIVHLAPLPRLFDSVILGAHVHAIQRVDGRVVIAKHFSGSPVGDPTTPDPDELIRIAARVLPGLKDATIEKVTETRRVIPADGLPVVSRSASLPGVLSITTNAGVSLAAGLSQLITTELLDNTRVALLDPYRSDRFERQAIA
ncbi:tRNA 5-methylaminomethyl-2-thiouridine biosynthesis bifunctional protein MnmC [Paraburkholderia phenoliruptrix]|uniref:FAD dependent oxidoreductase n=2 Tax=Paraburkholderia phenoliruptrix TaxID=252970 RepID=K0DYJ1_9BURK|nr:FAD-binding oxidoreductase [Paraburkholderia phenoliruptrix]AFT90010.1 FAD dependent oxidoreductase [Paraburkholderia phenoliruptrix BR3459a]CAB4052478.1 tRNA 5-methylaminomethyl-2-thiouridine biosynthesis bifunctional protein MnmC [Paraburkholderia phenoliruptrix]